ncbi:hypothetical protein [Dactylosporangium matsuzakiense]|uniref:Uncharacterized protein n=1 Tax=Dactylosporangium matsuzakiense TaxID=53360 RepID=A0A9W6KKT4_9ACTN|nr:hypothetical protein [Dactylosporangium matsuzakiense]UWZ42986.1 hypothetical protein Dmats_36585 [Dactylosporangium matsuzakiense]GLL03308.1 hypothetical protein GCM10017581_050520 [Dactylosporangium matsuzakiense]
MLAGALLGLARTREPGALDSLWAEDGQNFLTDALNLPWYEAILTPFNGYFHVVARLCWAFIALFPVAWAASLNAVIDAGITSALGLAVFRAARSRLDALPAALIGVVAALPMGFVPNALAQLQFPLVYAGLWMLLRERAGPLAIGLAGLAVLNSMLGVLLTAVAFVGLVRHRNREWAWKLLGVVPGSLLQLVPLLTGATRRGLGERPEHNPVAVAAMYLRWGVPRSFLGPAWLEISDDAWSHRAVTAIGLLIPVALTGLALWSRCYRELRLAAALAGFGALAGAVQLGAHGFGEDRYLVLISLPNLAAGVVLAAGIQRSGRALGCVSAKVPLVVFATLLTVVLAANFRPASPRDGSPHWGAAVAQARAECLVRPGLARVRVHIAAWPVLGWEAVLPCARLR